MAIDVTALRTNSIQEGEQLYEALAMVVCLIDGNESDLSEPLLEYLLDQLTSVVLDSRISAILDWWRMTRCGFRSNGAAFTLDGLIDEPLRGIVETVRDASRATENPILPALRARRRLESVLERFAIIVHHEQGKVGVQGVTWDEIEARYLPVLEDFRAGRPAEPPRLTKADIRSIMDRHAVRRGSEIWRKLERDWEELDDVCEEAYRLASGQASGFRGMLPERVGFDRTNSMMQSLAEQAMLSDLITDEIDPRAQGTRMVAGATYSTSEDYEWMAVLTRKFFEGDGQQDRRLQEERSRLKRVMRDIANLRRQNLDLSAAEAILEEGRLSDAEVAVASAKDSKGLADRLAGAHREISSLEDRCQTLTDAEDLLSQLDLLRGDLDDGAVDEVIDRLRELRSDLDQRIDESRIGEVERIRGELGTLNIRVDEQLEARVIAAVAGDTEIDEGDLRRLRDALEQARVTVRRNVEDRIRVVRSRLELEADMLPVDDRASIEAATRSAEDAISTDEPTSRVDLPLADRESRRAVRMLEQAVPKVWSIDDDGEEGLVDHIRRYMSDRLSFRPADVDRLYVGLKTKRFAILSGLTGSGKSTIARLFAESIGATAGNGRFVRVAVRPNWVDETDVLGYVHPTTRRFEPGWLASLVRSCHANPDLPLVCLLDEMNLAPVEYYLADYLSAMEDASSGSESSSLTLYSPGANPENSDDWPTQLDFPGNLFLIGTVNVDESTRPLSDRVLDRANVIQLSVEVGDRHHTRVADANLEARWQVRMSDWKSIAQAEPVDKYHRLLVRIADTMSNGLRIGLGIRAHIEVERFVANADGVMPDHVALDAALLQRVIPKIRGFRRDLASGLADLRDQLESSGCTRCVAVIDDWLGEGLSDDSFIDGTASRVGLVSS